MGHGNWVAFALRQAAAFIRISPSAPPGWLRRKHAAQKPTASATDVTRAFATASCATIDAVGAPPYLWERGARGEA